MKRLSKEQILMLHSQLIHQTGGTEGVRDFNLLESAIETPFQVFGGEELYPTIQAKGARLGYGLIKNHCMLDGNKRIGTHAMLVFFALNGIELRYTQKNCMKWFFQWLMVARNMKICLDGYWSIKSKFPDMMVTSIKRKRKNKKRLRIKK